MREHEVETRIPGDNHCLFWAAMLGYFVPYLNDDESYTQRFFHVFKNAGLTFEEIEEYKQYFQKKLHHAVESIGEDYRFEHNSIFLQMVFHFRQSVFHYMEACREAFEDFIEDNQDFDEYIASMRNNRWGGEAEIRAISDLLKVKLCVESQSGSTVYGENYSDEIHLNHTSYVTEPAILGAASNNHYNLLINRTLLESSLSGSHILDIYNERAACDKNSTSLANTLESNITTVFSSSRKFIYELLQNADDEHASSISFDLDYENARLLVSHTGNHFTKKDIEKICDNAQPNSQKSSDLEKTGYKGVGFKAVFCVSERVTVLSEQYRFCFSKRYWEETLEKQGKDTKGAAYPWAIIPIFINDTTFDISTIKTFEILGETPFEHCVHFLLEDININQIEAELNTIFQNPEVLIALRHISEVVVRHNDTVIQRATGEEYISLIHHQSGNTTERRWKINEQFICIPKHKKQAIQRLSIQECPEKLKAANTVALLFAAEINQEGMIIPQTNTRLFCYLPTQVDMGLPFWLNADFLLQQDRDYLLDNVWNDMLLEAIGYKQFEWLADLLQDADERIKYSALNVLNSLSNINNPRLSPNLIEAYGRGFHQGLREVAFIPGQNGDYFRIDQVIIDKTGFLENFSEYAQVDKRCVVDSQLKVHYKKLEDLNVQVFEWSFLLNNIEAYCHPLRDSLKAIESILFFLRRHLDDYWLPTLRTKAILPTESGLCSADKSYSVSHDTNTQAILNSLQIDIPYMIIQSKRLTLWAQEKLGVRELTKEDVVRVHILGKALNGAIPHDQIAIDLLRFIHRVYEKGKNSQTQGHLTQEDLKKLGKAAFPVYTYCISYQGAQAFYEFLPVTQCFYFEEGLSQSFVYGAPYIAANYYSGPNESLSVWREILSALGIQTQIGLTVFDKHSFDRKCFYPDGCISYDTVANHIAKTGQTNLRSFQKFSSDFKITYEKDYGTSLSRNTGKYDRFKHFITFDFLHRVSEPGFSLIFWELVEREKNKLLGLNKDKSLFKRGERGDKTIELVPYLVFHFSKVKCIRKVGDQNHYYAHELYAPHLNTPERLGDLPLPFADIPDISPEVAEFFGFKTEISFEDCINLLENNRGKDQKHFKRVYELLIHLYPNRHEKGQNYQFKALTSNHKLTPTNQLYLYDIPYTHAPEPDDLLINPCGLLEKEALLLSRIFNIRRLSDMTLMFTDENKYLAERIQALTDDHFLDVLPLLALLDINVFDLEKAIEKMNVLWHQYKQLNFYCGKIKFGEYEAGKVLIHAHAFYFSHEIRKNTIENPHGLIHKIISVLSSHLDLMMPRTVQLWKDELLDLEDFANYAEKFGCSQEDLAKLQDALSTLIEDTNSEIKRIDIKTTNEYQQKSKIKKIPIKFEYPDSNDSSYRPNDSNSAIDESSEVNSFKTPKQEEAGAKKAFSLHHREDKKKYAALKFAPTFFSQEKPLPPIDNRPSSDSPYKHNKINSKTLPPEKQQEKDNRKKETGNAGERLVFNKIKQMLKEQVNYIGLEEHESYLALRLTNGNVVKLDCPLLRLKPGEDEGSVDLTISINGQNIYYIEVKSTNYSENQNSSFFFSRNEWCYMREHREHYILVRVYDPLSEDPRLLVYKNPFEMIFQGLITMAYDRGFEFNITEDANIRPFQVEDMSDDEIGCHIS